MNTDVRPRPGSVLVLSSTAASGDSMVVDAAIVDVDSVVVVGAEVVAATLVVVTSASDPPDEQAVPSSNSDAIIDETSFMGATVLCGCQTVNDVGRESPVPNSCAWSERSR